MSDHTQRLEEAFRGLGLTETQARLAAFGRNPAGAGGFDGMVEAGRRLGLDERTARGFAIGRDGIEAAARRRLDEAARPAGDAFDRAQRLLNGLSDTECEQVVEAERRRRAAARTASASGGSDTARRVELIETGRPLLRESLPAMVRRVDELVEAGVPDREARRLAYAEIYG